MPNSAEYVANSRSAEAATVGSSGSFVMLDGSPAYRISDYHQLDPFLVNLASDTNLWMFISARGGLTAGRKDADGSLFPYLTDDRLHVAHRHSGPITLIRVERDSGPALLWEPFSKASARHGGTERNLYKNISGTQILFEEIEHDLALAVRYRWSACEEFGWVRRMTVENRGKRSARIGVLDGLRNVLPWGAPLALYQQASNLVDAYKSSELDPSSDLGIFSLTAGITDRPEALEILRANTVWCCGLEGFQAHLSLKAINAFRNGRRLPGRRVLNGQSGNYLVSAGLDLERGQSSSWYMAADAGRDHAQLVELRQLLVTEENLAERVETRLRQADDNLRRIIATADGLQLTGQPESSYHHFANVLFNNMRGGVFLRNDDVPVDDLIRLLRVRNRAVADRHGPRLAEGPEKLSVRGLRKSARASGDADLMRLTHEYMPLYFGRRHGDPSRPWNRFEIRMRDGNGRRVPHYEGNWRDIFQNWEALAASFPSYLPNMVSRFVSASTVDGFNPYRITQDGVDWEAPEPGDPWSNIGYWGDHQVVYLLRLLEEMDRYDPYAFSAMLDAEMFSYADVPYRIKPYEEILHDPQSTIMFDWEYAERIDDRVACIGTDGRLVPGADGGVYHVNLLEKLLVTTLSKLSNLIPGAGIWMNTQRPEWNDANNALGGGSVSVVTLCHLRRYLAFLSERLGSTTHRQLHVSTEVALWFDRIAEVLEREEKGTATEGMDPRDRKKIMDALSGAFSDYREAVYARGFSDRKPLFISRCAAFCRTAIKWVDASIAANRREDGLYHTYSQLGFSADFTGVEVIHLQKMLEGQVAVLSSGAIEPGECLTVLERLFSSDLYRPDQRSFMLYPERELPGFMARNVLPEEGISAIPLMSALLSSGDRSLWNRDASGVGRFHGDIRNLRDLTAILDDLSEQPTWSEAVSRDRADVLELFESVFAHRSYTGRSAAMYAYEGIGCIYWHMIAKLLLAVQETVERAEREGLPAAIRQGLAKMYFRVQSGLGYRKTVAEYGAIPMDPYSHTPPSGGAKQPGMTGQVKEEILTRLGELGVLVEAGTIRFRPLLLPASEFLVEPTEFQYFDVEGRHRTLSLSAGTLAFTFCQIPVIYERVEGAPWIHVTYANGSSHDIAGCMLEPELAMKIFERSGHVDRIRVALPTDAVWRS